MSGSHRAASGMTLIEVLAATAILMMTCAAVTTVVVTAAQAGSRASGAAQADAALANEEARLRALAFFSPMTSAAVDDGDWTGSVVGELFPHAEVALSTARGGFRLSGGVGSFMTDVWGEGPALVREAWFVSGGSDLAHAIGWEVLSGWRADRCAALPAEALLVRLSMGSGGRPGGEGGAGGKGERVLWCVFGLGGGSRVVD